MWACWVFNDIVRYDLVTIEGWLFLIKRATNIITASMTSTDWVTYFCPDKTPQTLTELEPALLLNRNDKPFVIDIHLINNAVFIGISCIYDKWCWNPYLEVRMNLKRRFGNYSEGFETLGLQIIIRLIGSDIGNCLMIYVNESVIDDF